MSKNDSFLLRIALVYILELVFHIFKSRHLICRYAPSEGGIELFWIGEHFRYIKSPTTVEEQSTLIEAVFHRLVPGALSGISA